MGLDTQLSTQFAAVAVHSPESYQRQGLDPRLGRKFLRGGSLAPEERQALQAYLAQSRWIPDERAVYGAVLDQFSTVEEIRAVTGLSAMRVDETIRSLEQKGLLRRITK